MRFLVVFVAVLGYASANALPYLWGVNAGDAQAAAIDATVNAQDHARAIGEGQVRAAEAAIQYNTEAARQVAESHRDINENVYWGSVAANQNAVAAAQSYAAAANGAAAAYAGHVATPWGYNGIQALGQPPWGVQALGYNNLGYNNLGYRAW